MTDFRDKNSTQPGRYYTMPIDRAITTLKEVEIWLKFQINTPNRDRGSGSNVSEDKDPGMQRYL